MSHTGIHHISVLSSNAQAAYSFYHQVLGMKLILNTVNQDDHAMYHLFFGDDQGREGTEFTVFDMGDDYKKNRFGSNGVDRSVFLVPSYQSLVYWQDRFEGEGVCHYGIEDYNGAHILRFEDQDGQPLGMTYRQDLDVTPFSPYVARDIQPEHAILGLAEVHLRVRYPEATGHLLTNHFGFSHSHNLEAFGKSVWVYTIQGTAFPHQVHLIVDKDSPVQLLGVGGVHHVAFGVEDRSELESLVDYLNDHNKHHSGIVYREFFHSLYFREPNYILFEVATPLDRARDSFQDQDLAWDQLALDLPDFLEEKRESIENDLYRKKG